MNAALELRGAGGGSWAGEVKEGRGSGDGVAVSTLGVILSGWPAGNARNPDGHLIFQGTILGELGLQVLHDLPDGHCVIFKPVPWLEGTHHMAHGKCVDSCLGVKLVKMTYGGWEDEKPTSMRVTC